MALHFVETVQQDHRAALLDRFVEQRAQVIHISGKSSEVGRQILLQVGIAFRERIGICIQRHEDRERRVAFSGEAQRQMFEQRRFARTRIADDNDALSDRAGLLPRGPGQHRDGQRQIGQRQTLPLRFRNPAGEPSRSSGAPTFRLWAIRGARPTGHRLLPASSSRDSVSNCGMPLKSSAR